MKRSPLEFIDLLNEPTESRSASKALCRGNPLLQPSEYMNRKMELLAQQRAAQLSRWTKIAYGIAGVALGALLGLAVTILYTL